MKKIFLATFFCFGCLGSNFVLANHYFCSKAKALQESILQYQCPKSDDHLAAQLNPSDVDNKILFSKVCSASNNVNCLSNSPDSFKTAAVGLFDIITNGSPSPVVCKRIVPNNQLQLSYYLGLYIDKHC